jgi:hypothetical protein
MKNTYPVLLALMLGMLATESDAWAQSRKLNPNPPGKKPAVSTPAVTKPLRLTPRKRALSGTNIVEPQLRKVATAKPKVLGAAKPEGLAALKSKVLTAPKSISTVAVRTVGRLPVKRRVTAMRLGNVPARQTVQVPRNPEASAIASQRAVEPVTLTADQKSMIYRTITDTPLQARRVTIERFFKPTVSGPSPGQAAVAAGPQTDGVANYSPTETEAVVGARLPPTVPLHRLPLSAVQSVPAIGAYRYAFVGQRVLLVDPATSIVIAAIKE